MPIYEYECSACNHQLEALQKMSDSPLTDCPNCGKAALVKKVSAAAFRLSGSGWYETDFKSGNKKNLAGDSGKPTSSTGSSGSKNEGKSGQSTQKADKPSPNKTASAAKAS